MQMSRRRHKQSPEHHRAITRQETRVQEQQVRRYAIATNLKIINTLRSGLYAMQEDGLLNDATKVALADWEHDHLATFIVDSVGDMQDARQERVQMPVCRTMEDLAEVSMRTGDMALRLAQIIPGALIHEALHA